jgi:hypothetical protein
MPDWITLDEEWLERTRQLLRRSVKEADVTLAQQLRDRACQSELYRREWSYGCWQKQERRRAVTTLY